MLGLLISFMNRFSLIGRCYMKESFIHSTSDDDDFHIPGLFPHRNGPVCEPDDVYDLNQLTAKFIFEIAAIHELSCLPTSTAEPKISFEP